MSEQKTLLVVSRELGLPANLLRVWCKKSIIPCVVLHEGQTGRITRAFTAEHVEAIRESGVYLQELVRRKEEALAKVMRYDRLIAAACKPGADLIAEERLDELKFKHKDHPVLNGELKGE